MTQNSVRSVVFEPMQDPIEPLGGEVTSTGSNQLRNLAEIACCMGKVPDAQGITPMTLHKARQPLRSILDGTHLSLWLVPLLAA